MAKAKQAEDGRLGLKWSERVVKVADLVPYDKNPRKISAQQYDRLKASLKETGYHTPMLAQPDLRIIGGHQRKKALTELGITEIPVRVPERELTDEEFKRVLIQSNVHFGDWEVDILLSDHDRDDLIAFGVDENIFPVDTQPEEDGEEESDLNTIIQYNIIFDSEAQQKIWFDFLKKLRNDMPGAEMTMAQRIIAFLSQHV